MEGFVTRNLHIGATIVHIISTILIYIFANERTWLFVNEFCTFLSHIIGIIIWTQWTNDRDTERWKTAEYTRRWLEYGITAGLLEVAILGTEDISRILSILGLNACLQFIGWVLDRNNKWKILLLFGFLILAIEIVLISNWSKEPVRTIVIYGVLYSLFGVIQTLQKFDVLPYDEDHIYTLLSVSTKIILTWTLIAHDNNDEVMEWIIFGIFTSVFIVGAIVLYKQPDSNRRERDFNSEFLL